MCVISLFLLQTIAVMVLPYECDRKQIVVLDGYKYCYQVRVQGVGLGHPPKKKRLSDFAPPPYAFLGMRLVKKQYQDDAKYFLHCV